MLDGSVVVFIEGGDVACQLDASQLTYWAEAM